MGILLYSAVWGMMVNRFYLQILSYFFHLLIPESFMYLISLGQSCLYVQNLTAWSNFNILHSSQWITFPTQSCLLLILTVSSLSPDNLHLLFSTIVLILLFCAQKRFSFSLEVSSSSRAISCRLKYPYYYYYYYFTNFSAFHISVSWWLFIGVWVTASLLKSPGLFSVFWSISSPPVTVPSAPITIASPSLSCFIDFFSSLTRSWYWSLFSLSFSFTQWSAGKVHFPAGSLSLSLSLFFYLLTIIRSGRLAEIRWSVWISESQRILCISLSRTDSGLSIYYLFVWSILNFLDNSKWITFPTQSYLILYSLCANLLHSFIIWLIISSLSPHNLHQIFCCILSILATPSEFSTPALASSLSRESEWQQVSSSLQDSSQYSVRYQ